MTTIDLLLNQYKEAHVVLKQVIDGISNEVLHKDPGGTANPVVTNYVHIIAGEDYVINVMLKNTETLASTIFKDNTGLNTPYPDMSDQENYAKWMKTATVDMQKFGEYAMAVVKASENYIASLTPEDLTKEIDLKFIGKKDVAYVLSIFVLWNIAAHTGEIAAIKGIQGLKGYPF